MPKHSPDFRPAFSRYPFVYLCSYFCFGILMAEKLLPYADFFFLCCGLLLSIAQILLTHNKHEIMAKQLRVLVLFSGLGFLATLQQFQLSGWDKWPFHSGKSIFNMKVLEIQKGQPWSKGIGEIQWKLTGKNQSTLVRFYLKGNDVPQLDDCLHVKAQVIPIENKGNPGEFDLQLYWKTKGIYGQFFMQKTDYSWINSEPSSWLTQWIRASQNWCNAILAKHLQGRELGIAQALILGDKTLLDDEIRSAFTATGSMHILAVSGLHIGLILQLLLMIMKLGARWIKRSTALLLIILLLWFYALMTGFSPSVIRAVFMFTVLTWTQWKGWQSSSINTLFFTAFIIVLWKPLYFFDLGFQLSYLAMLGIFLFYPVIAKVWRPQNSILAYLWEGTAIGFAAQIVTTPLTLYYFHQFPNYFAVANLGLMGLSTIVLGAGIFILGIHYLPFLGKLNGLILLYSIYWMFVFIQWIETWPGALVYGFDIPFIFIPILFILACFLFLGEIKRSYWKWSAIHFLLILAWMSVQRYQNCKRSSLHFLNENKLTIFLKYRQQTWCFYEGAQPQKINFSELNFLKIYPSQLKIIPILNRRVYMTIGPDCFQIEKIKGGRKICFKNRTWFIKNKVDPHHQAKSNEYFMPWIDHPNSLKFGAKMIPLAIN